MAVVDGDFIVTRTVAGPGRANAGLQEKSLWTEEPAKRGDYAIFIGALILSFGLFGFGFWALFSYLFPAM
ncbi:MAG: hypothetical protein WBN97_09610 [Parvibaculum sp.]|jgi:hypothetical protein